MSTEKIDTEEEKNTSEKVSLEEEMSSEEVDSKDEEMSSSEVVEILDERDVRIQELEAEVKARQADIDEVTARLRSVSAAYSRQGDEIKATRSRLERQMQYKESKNRGEVVSSLFEPFDNLKRCLDGLKQAEIEASHIEGLEMVKGTFVSAFQKLGLEEIPGKGSTFDPNIHEALLNVPVPDPALNGIVIDVHSTGYRINDIIIKPAKVIIGVCDIPAEEPLEADETIDVVESEEVVSEDDINVEEVLEAEDPTDSDSNE